MPRKDRSRSKAGLARKAGNRSGQRVLIVCEGSKTEPRYFEGLRFDLKLSGLTVAVDIAGAECGSAPISVVDHAIALRKKSQRDVPYDAVWCVFDREANPEHQSFRAAVDKANAHGLKLAVSVPCFEFWYLLHARYSTAPFDCADDLKAEVARCFPGYEGIKEIHTHLRGQRDTALAHAERVRRHHADVSDDPHANPLTDVDRLVRFLIDLKP